MLKIVGSATVSIETENGTARLTLEQILNARPDPLGLKLHAGRAAFEGRGAEAVDDVYVTVRHRK